MIYRIIADRRTRLFGVCQLSAVRTAAMPANPLATVGTGMVFSALPGAYVIAVLLFFTNWLAPLNAFPRGLLPNAIEWGYLSFGIARINVFNEPDLTTSANFVVAHRVRTDGSESLVPYTGLHGERLGMDNSDRILYGVSIPWRHEMSGIKDACYSAHQLAFLKDVATYDRLSNRGVPMAYRFSYYYWAPLTKTAIDRHTKIGVATASCSVVFNPATNQVRSAPDIAGRF
jgi:hypothetical protein